MTHALTSPAADEAAKPPARPRHGGTDESVIVAGIDEAGYGPLLGPLVTSTVMLAVPAASAGLDFWACLDGCVARRVRRRDPRLVITDSKALSCRRDGMKHLETAALSVIAAAGVRPARFRDLASHLCPHVLGSLAEYPWYAEGDFALPVAVGPDELETQVNALSYGLNRAGLKIEAVACRVLDVAQLNDLIARTNNKATVQFCLTLRLIGAVQARSGARACYITVDKQGGRSNYRAPLMTGLQLADLRVLQESDRLSIYAGAAAGDRWRLEFRESSEQHSLPAAAASILSKYLRELFMLAFNRFWSERVPGLKPTAGYYTDGRRFLRDIAAEAARLGIDRRLLVRSR